MEDEYKIEEVKDSAQIDLKKHALIEASAGTGKTYTIVALVMRLLKEGVDIDKILIVTFTDKATIELRDRIRLEITKQYNNTQESYLKNALNNFASVAVYTIHGFCQKILKEYAFESKGVFDLQLVEDKPIYKAQLNVIKRHWPQEDDIANQLEKINFNTQWQSDVLKISQDSDLEYDGFYPNFNDESSLKQKFNDSIKLLIEFDLECVSNQFASIVKQNGDVPAAWQKNNSEFLMPLFDVISQYKKALSDDEQFVLFANILKSWQGKSFYKAITKNYQTKMIEKFKSQLDYFFKFIDYVQSIGDTVMQLEALNKAKFTYATILELKKRVQQYKADKGFLSFNDMIDNLYASLNGEYAKKLKNILQAKYSHAFIDEFQDTDLKQWYIFKSIFTGQTEHKLFLIGDSKQAIYGFRGADVNAFFKAKADFLSLGNQAVGCYKLATNYRSLPDLLNNLDLLWSKTFYKDNSARVECPEQEFILSNGPLILKDTTGFASISLVETINEPVNVRMLKYGLAYDIAKKIKKLKNNFAFKVKGHSKVLDYSDICILVRSRSDADILEPILKKENIASSFYKKPGLFKSAEASEYLFLLQAMARPNDMRLLHKALLTDFFGLDITQIDLFTQGKLPRLQTFLNNILSFSQKGQWPRFFQYLKEYSPIFYLANQNKNYRRIANLRQITNELEQAAINGNLNIQALSRRLYNWQQNSKDEDIHQKDTEKESVKLMTIHASKGLEFPVVFVFGGFSQPPNRSSFYTYFDSDKQQSIYDISKSQCNKDAFDIKESKEIERLLYVAFTRAIFKLFLPFYQPLSRMSGAYTSLINNHLQDIKDLFSPFKKIDNKIPEPVNKMQLTENLSSFTDIAIDLKTRRKYIHSFSSLSHLYSFDSAVSTYDDYLLHQDDDITDDYIYDVEYLELPHGAKTGNVLHGIFENIDFLEVSKQANLESFFNNNALMQVIEHQMQYFKFKDKVVFDDDNNQYQYSKCFASLVFNTLNKPISALNNIRLSDIPKHNRKHELEFMLDYQGHKLTGFIDMFFRIDNKYYILDWKSNYSIDGYSRDILYNEIIKSHKYDLQYQLYNFAMQNWFDSLGIKQARLAGALYIFSRGIDINSVKQNGIYYEECIEDVQDKLIDLVTRKANQ